MMRRKYAILTGVCFILCGIFLGLSLIYPYVKCSFLRYLNAAFGVHIIKFLGKGSFSLALFFLLLGVCMLFNLYKNLFPILTAVFFLLPLSDLFFYLTGSWKKAGYLFSVIGDKLTIYLTKPGLWVLWGIFVCGVLYLVGIDNVISFIFNFFAERESEDLELGSKETASEIPTLERILKDKKQDTKLISSDEESDEVPLLVKRGIEKGTYRFPDVSLLEPLPRVSEKANTHFLKEKAASLEEKLSNYGVSGKVVGMHYGPVVTMFEFQPSPGIKVSKIANLSEDIALSMRALGVRIVAPIPGKDVVGIEIPNDKREPVFFREIVSSDKFKKSSSLLSMALGKDIFGTPFVADLKRMPHLLVAGATGSGKSIGLNCIICSILFKASPKEVKFILVDPKMLEFSVYNGIPHLITPVITDPKKAASALNWAVNEMERRYSVLTELGVRNIEAYNKIASEPLPFIVIVIDELADLMMIASKDVESLVARLAQKARAAGIHLIVATQRPSVDVITGVIKANFPSRISFKVSSKVDSRTILDTVGAEKLLGLGDMLFLPPGTSELIRLHGAYISDGEISRIADFWKAQGEPKFNEEVTSASSLEEEWVISDEDELYPEAVELVMRTGHASASMIQRYLKIGYNRAARMIERMEREGIVGPPQGSKPREVLKRFTD